MNVCTAALKLATAIMFFAPAGINLRTAKYFLLTASMNV
jgi:hypothetical protein